MKRLQKSGLWLALLLCAALFLLPKGADPVFSGRQTLKTAHFILSYTPADADTVSLVAGSAERAFAELQAAGFPLCPPQPVEITLFPDTQSLAESLGWKNGEKAMGAYVGGKIAVLSPKVWLDDVTDENKFDINGPMLHELVHLLVDELTEGNYNRWWTEGFAQYMEKKLHGIRMAIPSAAGKTYTLEELDRDFDRIPVGQAYRQSLLAIEYMIQNDTEDVLLRIMREAAGQKDLVRGITGVLHCSWDELENGYASYLTDVRREAISP